MKVGLRTPSIKKSIKARTTGKYKRKFKRLTNPFYGKKGIGWIKNPSRAFKNKIYHKMTFSAKDAIKGSSNFINSIFYYLIVFPMKWVLIFTWFLIKWSLVAFYYVMKYLLLGTAWIVVIVYNGVVNMVEKIINANREDVPINEDDVNTVGSDVEETIEKK